MKRSIQIVSRNARYVAINKPSSIQSDGFDSWCLLPQVTKYFKSLNPDKKLDTSSFSLVQRLDKHVTGGMIVSLNKDFTRRVNRYLRSKDSNEHFTFKRRYVGLVSSQDLKLHTDSIPSKLHELPCNKDLPMSDTPDSPNSPSGLVFFDDAKSCGLVDSPVLVSRYGKQFSKPSQTLIKILYDQVHYPSRALRSKYPQLFNKALYPVLIELRTGRKNQIRDHFFNQLQLPLLNDANFMHFKARNSSSNTTVFKSNQIGLHCAYIELEENAYHFPLLDEDRELWTGFVDSKGHMKPSIKDALSKWSP